MLASIVNPLILGISIGSILLISALGLAVIYGAAGVINMAHGEFIMLGAYSTYTLQSTMGMPFLLCIPCAFFIVGIIGFVIERNLICYLYNRPLDTLLATWGVSLVLMQSSRLIFGNDVKYIAMPEFLSTNLELGILNFSTFRLFLIAVALILLFITWFIFYRTRLGIKIRAVTQNKEMAASFGINAAQVYSITFAFGAGLAGAAGAMFGALSIVLPTMGMHYVVEAFLMVVTGGGSILGTVFASTLAGEIQSIFAFIFNDTMARGLLFILIVVLLRFRPQGLLSTGSGRR